VYFASAGIIMLEIGSTGMQWDTLTTNITG
jgi:hypothetical protein